MEDETRVDEESLAAPEQPRPAAKTVDPHTWEPVMSVEDFLGRRSTIDQFITEALVEKVDYGPISERDDRDKRFVLLKPGAEKLCIFFGLVPEFSLVSKTEQWPTNGQEGVFSYHYKCTLYRGGIKISEGEGSCNSLEIKYRWRWVDHEQWVALGKLPYQRKDASSTGMWRWQLNRRQTDGQYGKPEEFWQQFDEALQNGTAKVEMRDNPKGRNEKEEYVSIPSVKYRIANPESPDLVNTFVKIAKKRAHVDVTLSALGLSERFTQDIGDPEADDEAPAVKSRKQTSGDPEFDQREPAQATQGKPPAAASATKAEDDPKVLLMKVLSVIGAVNKARLNEALLVQFEVDDIKSVNKEDYVKAMQYLASLSKEEILAGIAKRLDGETAQETQTSPAQAAAPATDGPSTEEFATLAPSAMLNALHKKYGVPFGLFVRYITTSYGIQIIPKTQTDEFQNAAQELIELYGGDYSPDDIRTIVNNPHQPEES